MSEPADNELVELLDRVIDKGVVVSGDVRLSVAGIELIYINLRALIASSDRVIEDTPQTRTATAIHHTSSTASSDATSNTASPETTSPKTASSKTASSKTASSSTSSNTTTSKTTTSNTTSNSEEAPSSEE